MLQLSDFQPMKAPSESVAETMIRFPAVVSAKLDGLRAAHTGQMLVSKTQKAFPNQFVQALYADARLAGLDGELVVGAPTGEDVIRRTTSGVMSIKGVPQVTWWVFDDFTNPTATFQARYHTAVMRVKSLPASLRKFVRVVEHVHAASLEAMLLYEAKCLSEGYEGLMIRDPLGPYKFGRSTMKQGWLCKFKRFVDSEAVITGIEEGQHNDNERKADGKRRTLKANMRPSGVVGAVLGQDVKTGMPIRIAPGRLTHDERRYYFLHPQELIGKIATYRHFPTGTVNAPRFPTFRSFRHPQNM